MRTAAVQGQVDQQLQQLGAAGRVGADELDRPEDAQLDAGRRGLRRGVEQDLLAAGVVRRDGRRGSREGEQLRDQVGRGRPRWDGDRFSEARHVQRPAGQRPLLADVGVLAWTEHQDRSRWVQRVCDELGGQVFDRPPREKEEDRHLRTAGAAVCGHAGTVGPAGLGLHLFYERTQCAQLVRQVRDRGDVLHRADPGDQLRRSVELQAGPWRPDQRGAHCRDQVVDVGFGSVDADQAGRLEVVEHLARVGITDGRQSRLRVGLVLDAERERALVRRQSPALRVAVERHRSGLRGGNQKQYRRVGLVDRSHDTDLVVAQLCADRDGEPDRVGHGRGPARIGAQASLHLPEWRWDRGGSGAGRAASLRSPAGPDERRLPSQRTDAERDRDGRRRRQLIAACYGGRRRRAIRFRSGGS